MEFPQLVVPVVVVTEFQRRASNAVDSISLRQRHCVTGSGRPQLARGPRTSLAQPGCNTNLPPFEIQTAAVAGR